MSFLYTKHALHSTLTSQVLRVPTNFIPNPSHASEYIILNHGTHLRIYAADEHGLSIFRHYSVHAVISHLEFVTINNKPHLLLLTHQKDILIMHCTDDAELELLAHGNLNDRIGRLLKRGDKVRRTPSSSHTDCLLMLLYEGILKYLDLNDIHNIEAKNIRLPELDVIDFAFVNAPNLPPHQHIFTLLFRDAKTQRYIKTYSLDTLSLELTPHDSLHPMQQVDSQATMLIPLPNGAIIVCGGVSLTYLAPADSTPHNFPATLSDSFKTPTQVTAYTQYDNSSYFIGTIDGFLYKLDLSYAVHSNTSHATQFKLSPLGEISIPSDLQYLGNGYIHVASICADSQLIQYSDDVLDLETQQHIILVDEFENVAPIMDATIVDFDKQGQGAMVTCSGVGTAGTLRIITNGVSIESAAETQLSDASAIFSLSSKNDSLQHDYLVLSFPSETRVLGFTDDEFGPVEVGFNQSLPTLTCASTTHDSFVQVTKDSVLLVDRSSASTLDEWIPANGQEILLSTIHKDHILVSTGHTLFLLQQQGDSLVLVAEHDREHLVASIAMRGNMCAVVSWNSFSVELLNLPDFSLIDSQILKDNIIPRSLLFCAFEGIEYLLVGLGDGTLFYFSLDPQQLQLTGVKKIIIGTKSISLNEFQSHGSTYVFASSDRATIVYSQNKKLIFSNVNMKDLIGLCSFNHEQLPDGLGLITPDLLTLGQITEIQNIQVKKVPLKCQPTKIAFDEQSVTIGVCTTASINGVDVNHVKLFQAYTFEELHSVQLQNQEYSSAMCCVRFPNTDHNYYVVGTAFVSPENKEPHRGRILVFEVDDNRLHLVHETEVKGAVYAFASLHNGQRLLSAVNSRVYMWEWNGEESKLENRFMYVGHLLCLNLQTRNDFVLVGDLIRSVSVLRFDAGRNELVEIARDFNMLYVTATSILDDDHFLVVDHARNIVILRKSTSEDDVRRLTMTGQYHLGESVNVICEGSLKMRMDMPEMRTFAYGSNNGAVAIMATLTPQQYQLFDKIQRAMQEVCGASFGCLKQSEFRAFKTSTKTIASHGFIDGDFVESYLSLDVSTQDEIANRIEMNSREDIVKEIERISQALV